MFWTMEMVSYSLVSSVIFRCLNSINAMFTKMFSIQYLFIKTIFFFKVWIFAYIFLL